MEYGWMGRVCALALANSVLEDLVFSDGCILPATGTCLDGRHADESQVLKITILRASSVGLAVPQRGVLVPMHPGLSA